MSAKQLLIWPAIVRNLRSLGESFLIAVTKYPWVMGIGAFAGYLLDEVRTYGSYNAMTMYWSLILVTLVLLAFIGCKHASETITGTAQRYPSFRRGFKYFFFGILLVVLITGVIVLGSVVGFIGISGKLGGGVTIWTILIVISWILGIYLSSRVILVLPAIAVGNDQTGFKRSWELTKGNEWRVICILFATYLIMAVVMKIPDLLSEFLLGGDILGALLGAYIMKWVIDGYRQCRLKADLQK